MPLLIVSALSQIGVWLLLAWRGWWRFAPCFMVFWGLSCLQAGVGLFDRPHGMAWWHNVWTPVEIGVITAALGAVAEVLVWCTRYLDSPARFSWRFSVPMVACGFAGFFWSVDAPSIYGKLVLSREFLWAAMALANWMTILYFYGHPDATEAPEAKRHALILGIILTAHATIAPLNRLGFGFVKPQEVFEMVLLFCCAAYWISFGSDRLSPDGGFR